MIEYKGYQAQVEFDSQDNVFVGTVVKIKDVLGFHGSSEEELMKAFRDCIDDYLERKRRMVKRSSHLKRT